MTGGNVANGLLGKYIGGPVFAVTGCWEAGGKTLFGCGVAVGIGGLNGGYA